MAKRKSQSKSSKSVRTATGGGRRANDVLAEMLPPLTLAACIQADRLSAELTQAEAADMLGVSKAFVSAVENGRKRLSPERARDWAETFGSSEWLYVKLALQQYVDDIDETWRVELVPS